ncbi:hypothetical protein [Clostridium sp. B9]|uniref:hypothetical protein n=1 Tax=Clostridium sp. B9 TaxID=3423224 RepID=UPI003D2EC05A
MVKEKIRSKFINEWVLGMLLFVSVFIIFYQGNIIKKSEEKLIYDLEQNMAIIQKSMIDLRDEKNFDDMHSAVKEMRVIGGYFDNLNNIDNLNEGGIGSLFREFDVMINDSKERACTFFENEENRILLKKVSMNYEDWKSINELIKRVGY